MIKNIFFISILCLASIDIYADNWYKVELIAFENVSPVTRGELWQSDIIPRYDHSILLNRADDPLIAFNEIAPNRYSLHGIYRALERASTYQPLLHLGWQQPALIGTRSKYVRVIDTMGKIDGTVRVRSGPLLFVELDLSYIIDANKPLYTTIKEARKIKLNELHYFDHPLFGIIIRVSRLETNL